MPLEVLDGALVLLSLGPRGEGPEVAGLPVFGLIFREYRRYWPDLSLRSAPP
jgi:hypothetical protein